MPQRVFVLSPARSDGRRAQYLINPAGKSELAARLREPAGAPLGEVFSFLSGLYFRGKLSYAHTFSARGVPWPSTLIITADRGLVAPDTMVRREDLERFSEVDISSGDDRYLAPVRRDVERLAASIPDTADVVLLGSIATGKYVDPLVSAFGARLLFPIDFVGRGDMSRGGLLLRSAREGRELEYAPVQGAVRRGSRPPRLDPVRAPRRSRR
ncbi:MAG TPA: hypothetical protein VFZ21_12160 [Gemmatimonadaceae bacterium]|jgi:hypothetical protein|nr:hypothetical protein [Gemmatimonadaceae bacterium]